MSSPWPESTGLPESGASPRRAELTILVRQATGIFRAACRARLRPPMLATRLTWLFTGQAVLAAVAALGLQQAGRSGGLGAIPLWAGDFVAFVGLVLLLIHALSRLAALGADALRDVDEQLLDAYAASPLAGSAYVAGRMAFLLLEQGLGFAALMPTFALAYAMRAVEPGGLLALALTLLAVSVSHGLFTLGRVLRAHARRARGMAMSAGARPGAGALVAQALLGALACFICMSFLVRGLDWLSPALLFFALTPAMPLLASFGGLSADLFGRPVTLWIPAAIGLGLLAPLAWKQACLRWKARVGASGAGLRWSFALAWLVPSLALAATLRNGPIQTALPLLLMAAAGALILPAWAGAGELARIGERPGARFRLVFGARTASAGPWALLLQGVTLLLLAALAPAGPGLLFRLALAGAAWLGTAPTILVLSGAARWLGGTRAGAIAMAVAGLVVLSGLAVLPQVLSLFDVVPGLGTVTAALSGPTQFLAASSPWLLLPEAASSLWNEPALSTWLDLPAPLPFGLPVWGAGAIVQAVFGLPAAALLHHLATRAGR